MTYAEHQEDKNQNTHHKTYKYKSFLSTQRYLLLPTSIVIAALAISGAWVYTARLKTSPQIKPSATAALSEQTNGGEVSINQEVVIPQEGVELPIVWGDVIKRVVDAGVIDLERFELLYSQRGGLSPDMTALLRNSNNKKIRITPENSGVLLNIAWALGLGNKNPILDEGPMNDEQYGGADNFASTGGWSLAKGDAMEHYSKHEFITLKSKEQALVERVSKGIYRPCCGNSVHFPDCNHGMAMLVLLELMASQGVSEKDMYKAALAVNSYWFPDTYLTIAMYMQGRGVAWNKVSPEEMLGANYSGAAGFQRILSQGKVSSGPGGWGGGGGAPPLPLLPLSTSTGISSKAGAECKSRRIIS